MFSQKPFRLVYAMLLSVVLVLSILPANLVQGQPQLQDSSLPTPTPLPAPVLVEPEEGASFADNARFKFIWYRRLEPNERFSIQIQAVGHPPEYDWWPGEQDILEGGGAIHPTKGGYLYEVNVRLRPVSLGEAHWRVAVMGEQGPQRWQVSPWSAERQIYRVPWVGRTLG